MPKKHVETIIENKVPKEYEMQVALAFAMLPELEEVVFISYNHKVIAKPYFEIKVTREDFHDNILKLKSQYFNFEDTVESNLELFL